MTQERKRLAILTGGGDCPGLNAVIRAVAITAFNQYGYETIGFFDGFEGLYEEKYNMLCCGDVKDLLHIGGTILGTTNIGHYCLPLTDDVVEKTVATYKKLKISCIVCIGGDGTMSIAYRLMKHGINVVGVPKTIDNDLRSTDQTFGFDSAVSVATEAMDRLHTTAASHHRVMIVEVMGRNAGWIALNSGVAGGASVILLPEVTWTWDFVIERIKEQVSSHRSHYCLVVVAEGARLPEGIQIGVDEGRRDQRIRLGGLGIVVAEQITKATGYETRSTVLGHVQRGGSPTCFDRILATKYGSIAAKLACEGTYGKMVSLRGTIIKAVNIEGEMEIQKTVDLETDQLVWAAKACGVSFGDEPVKQPPGTDQEPTPQMLNVEIN